MARLFFDGSPCELVLTDCTQLDAACMLELLQDCISPLLERLELGSCGRGFGEEAARAAAKLGPLSNLQVGGRGACNVC